LNNGQITAASYGNAAVLIKCGLLSALLVLAPLKAAQSGQQLPDSPGDPAKSSEPGSTGGGQSSQTFRVDRVAFRGNKILRSKALLAVAAPYLGRELTTADVEELRIALTRQYTSRGYINSGAVLDPNAPYHEGVLSFLVIEGHLKEIRVHGLKGLHSAYVVDRLQGPSDEVLNINVLRARFQPLLDDPLFAKINSRIEPGPYLGEAILEVDAERAKPYSMAVALNNYRPPSIGEKGYDVSGQVRDLTGWGDVLDAGINGPLEFTGGVGYTLGWQIPVNHYGTQMAISASRSEAVIVQEPLTSLNARSTIEVEDLRVTQLVASSLAQQFAIGISFAREKESTVLAEEDFASVPGVDNGVTRANTVRLIPEYSYRTERQYLGARVTILYANLLDQTSQTVGYAQPSPHYFVWNGQLHHLLEFSPLPFELESRLTVQHADTQISDLHQLEIGGINSVRGFQEDEILLANVKNLNIDFRWLALMQGTSAHPGLTIGTFFDWADGYNSGQPNNTFSSTGATMRVKWPHARVDFAYGIPIIQPGFVSGQHGAWQDHGINLQLLATF
jgi:hemolysin activation/secretion protein